MLKGKAHLFFCGGLTGLSVIFARERNVVGGVGVGYILGGVVFVGELCVFSSTRLRREPPLGGSLGTGERRSGDGMGWQGDFAVCENMRVGAGE